MQIAASTMIRRSNAPFFGRPAMTTRARPTNRQIRAPREPHAHHRKELPRLSFYIKTYKEQYANRHIKITYVHVVRKTFDLAGCTDAFPIAHAASSNAHVQAIQQVDPAYRFEAFVYSLSSFAENHGSECEYASTQRGIHFIPNPESWSIVVESILRMECIRYKEAQAYKRNNANRYRVRFQCS